ncbi:uncharacterized protein LOC103703734 [Phoenix dactylifera]|uniref:Uncharacterized protein LOC103703734 n=1 Tax=Phoenix dactylifera TaxID=42345 RepID=A0A8B7BT99_PHODC|nr:uncharacterized protein LOC103703734 [Phoenix dactylifera]
MGSLMAGWNTPVQDPKAARYQRNRSLTRGEIDAYWKSKKKTEEEHLRELSGFVENNQGHGSGEKLQRSSSLPLTDRREGSLNNIFKSHDERNNKTNCWWTWSNWAFLNEPPVTAMEGPSYKYASQYHVANFGSSSAANNSEISV